MASGCRKHWSQRNGEAPPPLRSSWRDFLDITLGGDREPHSARQVLATWKNYKPGARSSRFRMLGCEDA
jgi:hypothetical protein